MDFELRTLLLEGLRWFRELLVRMISSGALRRVTAVRNALEDRRRAVHSDIGNLIRALERGASDPPECRNHDALIEMLVQCGRLVRARAAELADSTRSGIRSDATELVAAHWYRNPRTSTRLKRRFVFEFLERRLVHRILCNLEDDVVRGPLARFSSRTVLLLVDVRDRVARLEPAIRRAVKRLAIDRVDPDRIPSHCRIEREALKLLLVTRSVPDGDAERVVRTANLETRRRVSEYGPAVPLDLLEQLAVLVFRHRLLTAVEDSVSNASRVA